MTLYINNRPVLHKFYSNECFLFFKIYTKKEYFEFLDSKQISYYSYDSSLEFSYNVKKKDGVNVSGYYLMEMYPDFVYSKDILEHKSYFCAIGIREYTIEESYLKHGPKGLCIQTREHDAIELIIGHEYFVCFKSDLQILESKTRSQITLF